MLDLRQRLSIAGIDPASLQTLREVAVEGDEALEKLPETPIERLRPICVLPCEPEKLNNVWQQLYNVREMTHRYPVILGTRKDLGHHWEMQEDRLLPGDYVRRAEKISVSTWTDRVINELLDEKLIVQHIEDDETQHQPQNRKNASLFDVRNYVGSGWTKNTIFYIGLIKSPAPWQIAAQLAFGCWNDCPCPEIHVAFHHYWYSQYAMEPIIFEFDSLVCRVGNPPNTLEDALRLAREIVAYCPDYINLASRPVTLKDVAAELLNNTVWAFWWD